MVTPRVPYRPRRTTTDEAHDVVRRRRGARLVAAGLTLVAGGLIVGSGAVSAAAPGASTSSPRPIRATSPDEPWPLDAFVVHYRFEDPSTQPAFVSSLDFEVGRVGAGIPAASVFLTYPSGETETLHQAIGVESWNVGLGMLIRGELDGDDDCRLATQTITVSFGGDEIASACRSGAQPHEPWLEFLEPFSAELPDLKGPTPPLDIDDIMSISYVVVDGVTTSELTISRDPDHRVHAQLLTGDPTTAAQGTIDLPTWTELATLVVDETAAFVDCPETAPMSSVQVVTFGGDERVASWCATDPDPLTRALADVLTTVLVG